MPDFNHKSLLKLMGKQVVVSKELGRSYCQKEKRQYRFWDSRKRFEDRVGWVIGIRNLQNGYYVPGQGYYDDYEPPRLETDSKILMVTYWPTEKPVYVPLDGFRELSEDDDLCPFPSTWGRTTKDRKKNIGMYKEDCKKEGFLIRDDKGRFDRYRPSS